MKKESNGSSRFIHENKTRIGNLRSFVDLNKNFKKVLHGFVERNGRSPSCA